eukprot:1160816-Pelagomonas_calceolata.AAC.7
MPHSHAARESPLHAAQVSHSHPQRCYPRSQGSRAEAEQSVWNACNTDTDQCPNPVPLPAAGFRCAHGQAAASLPLTVPGCHFLHPAHLASRQQGQVAGC